MEENIWEISISCPALRLPILLSPEQGRRTEEPLNGSQQADWGGFAAAGSRHMLGAGRLGQLLWKISCLWVTDSSHGAVLSDGESVSFTRDRKKSPKGQICLPLAHPISHPEPPTWDSRAEGQRCRLEQDPGQKGSPMERGLLSERSWSALSWPESPPLP